MPVLFSPRKHKVCRPVTAGLSGILSVFQVVQPPVASTTTCPILVPFGPSMRTLRVALVLVLALASVAVIDTTSFMYTSLKQIELPVSKVATYGGSPATVVLVWLL